MFAEYVRDRNDSRMIYHASENEVCEAVTVVCGVWDEIASDTLRGPRILDLGFGNCITLAVSWDDTLRGPHILVLGDGKERYAAAYGNAFCRAQVTMLDHEAPTRIAHELSGNTFETRCRHFLYDDLGGPYDIAFLSSVLNGISAKDSARLLKRIHEVLDPGGAVVIGDMLMGAAELMALLNEAGFCQHERIPVRNPDYEFIVGRPSR